MRGTHAQRWLPWRLKVPGPQHKSHKNNLNSTYLTYLHTSPQPSPQTHKQKINVSVRHWDLGVVVQHHFCKSWHTMNSLGKRIYMTIIQTTSDSSFDTLVLEDLWTTHHLGACQSPWQFMKFPSLGHQKDSYCSTSNSTLFCSLSFQDPYPHSQLENLDIIRRISKHSWTAVLKFGTRPPFHMHAHQGVQEPKGAFL